MDTLIDLLTTPVWYAPDWADAAVNLLLAFLIAGVLLGMVMGGMVLIDWLAWKAVED